MSRLETREKRGERLRLHDLESNSTILRGYLAPWNVVGSLIMQSRLDSHQLWKILLWCLPFMKNTYVAMYSTKERSTYSIARKTRPNRRRAFGCMTLRVNRQIHKAPLLNGITVVSLIMQPRLTSH